MPDHEPQPDVDAKIKDEKMEAKEVDCLPGYLKHHPQHRDIDGKDICLNCKGLFDCTCPVKDEKEVSLGTPTCEHFTYCAECDWNTRNVKVGDGTDNTCGYCAHSKFACGECPDLAAMSTTTENAPLLTQDFVDRIIADRPARLTGRCTLPRDHWYVVDRMYGPAVCVICGKTYSPND